MFEGVDYIFFVPPAVVLLVAAVVAAWRFSKFGLASAVKWFLGITLISGFAFVVLFGLFTWAYFAGGGH